MSSTEMHELREVIGEGRFGRPKVARCSCGWRSDECATRTEAEDDHLAHRLAEIPDDDPRSR